MTLYAWAKDKAGNVSLSKSASVTVDIVKPVVSEFTYQAQGTAITVVTLVNSDNIKVTGYLITESSTAPLATASTWSDTAPTSYTATAIGKIPYAWVMDAAGNVSLAKIGTISTVDITKPVVTVFTVPAAYNSLTVPVTTLTATDTAGVTGYLINESPTTPQAGDTGWAVTKPTSYAIKGGTADGSYTLYAWAKDAAGNVSAAKSATVTIDTTVPVVTDFTIPATGSSLAVPVNSFAATDAVGVTGYLITESATAPLTGNAGWSATAPATYNASSAAVTTLYGWAKDTVGNVSLALSADIAITIP
jgi:hypothetical protein